MFKSENPKLPHNYRCIAVANCFGKIFNSILKTRLDKFLAKHNVIHESQIGFSEKSPICAKMPCRQIYCGGKTICVCFVYFRKAFDTVIHPGIRLKLLRNIM